VSDTKTETTLRSNIEAARIIIDTVKTTLGPMGRDKLLVDAGGNTIVTNDGATILRELDVSHPAAKMIIECAKTQEAECYDGTTTSVILAGSLLKNSEALMNKGLHPNLVSKGYHEAARLCMKRLGELSGSVEEDDETYSTNGGYFPGGSVMRQAIITAITGKTLEADVEHVVKLVMGAVDSEDKPRVVCLPGGSLSDSELWNGVVVNKTYAQPMPKFEIPDNWEIPSTSGIMLLNQPSDEMKSDDNVQVQLDMKGYSQMKATAKEDTLASAKLIASAFQVPAEKLSEVYEIGVVFVREQVEDAVVSYLKKHNIAVVKRVPESIMQAMSKATGAPIYHSPSDDIGRSEAVVEEREIDEVKYLFVGGLDDSPVKTLVVRGSTRTTLDETERGFDDALGVASIIHSGGDVVWGGGTTYCALAMHLRNEAASVSGRKQMAIEAFADALESIPSTLAENSGHDPLDCILAMRKALYDDPDMEEQALGPDVEEGGLIDMKELGVLEPAKLVRQSIMSATEVTTAMLKIDDMVAKRGE
jgi:chaperonin GroEL (HSP60 family)